MLCRLNRQPRFLELICISFKKRGFRAFHSLIRASQLNVPTSFLFSNGICPLFSFIRWDFSIGNYISSENAL